MVGDSRTLFVAAACSALIACGGSEPEPNSQFQAGSQQQYPQQQYPQQQYPQQQYPQQQYPQQQYPQQQYPQQQYPQAGAPSAGTAPMPAGTMAVPTIPMAPAGSPAQPLDASAAAGPIQLMMDQLAASDAPGAKPIGSPVVGMFQPGQQLESTITMQPGKCYTVIAVGTGMSDLKVQLAAATPVPGMNPVLAQDQTTGPQAVVGKAPNCYAWALPLPGSAKVITTAVDGQGIAAVQVYEK